MKNNGKPFERLLENSFQHWEGKWYMRVRKVDPPLRYVRGKVLHLRNPWLDYVGVLREETPIPIMLEAKSTNTEALPIGGKSGLTENQIEAWKAWSGVGFTIALLWWFDPVAEMRYLTLSDVLHTLEHRKSIRWEWARKIDLLQGNIWHIPAVIKEITGT